MSHINKAKVKAVQKERERIHHRHSMEARLGIVLAAIVGGIFIYHTLTAKPAPIQLDLMEGPSRPISSVEIVRGDPTKKQVIFTFDGGAGADSGSAILDVLAKHHVKGTFFLTGAFIKQNPELVKRMILEGHEIFDHTLTHPHLPTLSDDEITAELKGMSDTLASTTGLSSGHYFRPPYGDRDQRVLTVAAKAGYRSVYWTEDALDWEEPNGETADMVKTRILENVRPGTIYLMHVGDGITGAILDDVFTTIESKGYKPVSLTQGI